MRSSVLDHDEANEIDKPSIRVALDVEIHQYGLLRQGWLTNDINPFVSDG
jgi:hypothetical protein